jgi:hypothetical protein
MLVIFVGGMSCSPDCAETLPGALLVAGTVSKDEIRLTLSFEF